MVTVTVTIAGTSSKKTKTRAVPQGIVSRAANGYGVTAGDLPHLRTHISPLLL